MTLHRLVYQSRSRVPVGSGPRRRMFDAILGPARRNNARDDITGILVHGGGRFMQVLEGPREQVAQCFQRIGSDPRHHEIRLIAFEPVPVRAFAAWELAFFEDDLRGRGRSGGSFRSGQDVVDFVVGRLTTDLAAPGPRT